MKNERFLPLAIWPAFGPRGKKAYFTKTAVGHYVMTQENVLSCRRFDDAIAVAS